MNDFPWATVITPLATILFGGVLSALVTHYMTVFRTDNEYRLRKLEELHGLCGHHFKLSSEMVAISSMANWQQDSAKAKRREELYHKIADILIDVQTIYDIYFEDLAPRFMEWNYLSERAKTLAIIMKTAKDKTYMDAVLESATIDKRAYDQFRAVIQDIKDESKRVRGGSFLAWLRGFIESQR